MKALIENIQHYSLHDGPGIRTTIFFKGCPLKCKWCSNPTTQNMLPNLLFNEGDCLKCGKCVSACPKKAISIYNDAIMLDRALCDGCGICVEECSGGALFMDSQWWSIDDVLERISADMPFYRNSGGGLSLSGGEVLCQAEFAEELCRRCSALGISLAMETSAFAAYDKFAYLANLVDHVYVDVKHLNPDAHKRFTGADNKPILDNLARFLAETDKFLHIRLPLVDGVNNSGRHLRKYGAFLAELPDAANRIDLELLPYHRLGRDKYKLLGRQYELESLPPLPAEKALDAMRVLREAMGGIHVFCQI